MCTTTLTRHSCTHYTSHTTRCPLNSEVTPDKPRPNQCPANHTHIASRSEEICNKCVLRAEGKEVDDFGWVGRQQEEEEVCGKCSVRAVEDGRGGGMYRREHVFESERGDQGKVEGIEEGEKKIDRRGLEDFINECIVIGALNVIDQGKREVEDSKEEKRGGSGSVVGLGQEEQGNETRGNGSGSGSDTGQEEQEEETKDGNGNVAGKEHKGKGMEVSWTFKNW